MNTPPFYTLNHSCDEALQWAKTKLLHAGLRVMQTFDLNSARHTLEDCPCPHHGTDACDCQMIVLLVYEEKNDPVTLILHGNGGKTLFSVEENIGQKSRAEIERVIRNILMNKLPT